MNPGEKRKSTVAPYVFAILGIAILGIALWSRGSQDQSKDSAGDPGTTTNSKQAPNQEGGNDQEKARSVPTLDELRDLLTELAATEDRSRADQIRALLQSNGSDLQNHALELLVSDSDAGVRKQALKLLCRVCTKDAAPRLLQFAREETDPFMRKLAIGRLGELRFEGSLEFLKSLVTSGAGHERVFDAALQATVLISPDLALELSKGIFEDPSRTSDYARVSKILASLQDVRSAELIQATWARLANAATAMEQRKYYFFLSDLARFGPDILAPLSERFLASEKNAALRNAFVYHMAEGDPEFAVSLLTQIVEGPHDATLRRQAFISIGRVRSPSAAGALLKFLPMVSSQADAQAIILGLKQLDPKHFDYEDLLAAYSTQADAHVQRHLASVLSHLPDISKDQSTLAKLRVRALEWLEDPKSAGTGTTILAELSGHHAKGAADLRQLHERFDSNKRIQKTVLRKIMSLNVVDNYWRDAVREYAFEPRPASRNLHRSALKYCIRFGTKQDVRRAVGVMVTSDDESLALEVAKTIHATQDEAKLKTARESLAEVHDEDLKTLLGNALSGVNDE